MTPKTAELILSLAHELKKSQSLATRIADEQTAFDEGESEILQLAAERIIERIFQAATALPEQYQVEYFGEDPLRFLRGMRNRIAHNYLSIDHQILRSTIQHDLPLALRFTVWTLNRQVPGFKCYERAGAQQQVSSRRHSIRSSLARTR